MRRRLLRGAAVVVVVVAMTLWLAVGSPWFRVSTVTYVGFESEAQRATIAEAADVPMGQPLVQVDTTAIAERVMRVGTVAAVDVSRGLPDRVVVSVQPREPVVAVAIDGKLRVVDAQGVAFAAVSSPPKGVPLGKIARAGNADDVTTLATVVHAIGPDLRRRVSGVTVDATGRANFTVDKVAVVWGDAGQSDLKARVLSLLLKQSGVTRINVSVPERPTSN